MINDEIKLKLVETRCGKQEYMLTIKNKKINCFELNDASTDSNFIFKDSPTWIIVLFAGWSGRDLFFVKSLIDLSENYPSINFGFKAYNELKDIEKFSAAIDSFNFTPVLIGCANNRTNILNTGPSSKQELLEFISGFVGNIS